ncbi:hypothetical protein ASE93_23515 [Serratia sp. Leaf50]|nr:hypothetical protein ASE93_23515 [Serratia sp. Leaf50]
MKKKMALAALVLSACSVTAAQAGTDVFQQTDNHQLLAAQNATNAKLDQILAELKTMKTGQGTQDLDCYNGEKRYTQGFTVTTQDNTTLRCDMKNGHAAWVNNAIVFTR